MAMCPAGHQTNQSDFCDVCGLPVNAPAPVAASPMVPCPNCATENVPEALFCESCGYDFTTGTMPTPTPAPQWPTLTPPTPVTEATPPNPAAAPPPAPPASDPSPTPASAPSVPEEPTPVAAGQQQAAPDEPKLADTAPADGTPAAEAQPSPPPARPGRPPVDWVAELWIDPDWYASQGSTDPMPSVGLPDIVGLVKPANLIGRVSHSRGIFPDIDCELDSGCSRRHAMLTHDGTRWWVEDLNSANGTFVGQPAGPLPAMPIPQGRVELAEGQRIYVGAWTRIVIRPATDDEREAFGS